MFISQNSFIFKININLPQKRSFDSYQATIFLTKLYFLIKVRMNNWENMRILSCDQEITRICLHKHLPILLSSTREAATWSDYKESLLLGQIRLEVEEKDISGWDFCDREPVFAARNYIFTGARKHLVHMDSITHMQADESSLIMSSSQDHSLALTTPKSVTAQLHGHNTGVSTFYWHHSLAISGDNFGYVLVWDINKCKWLVEHRHHYKKINYLQAYTNFTHLNIYFAGCVREKSMSFYDLRTCKPITKANHLLSGTQQFLHSQNGLVYAVSESAIQCIYLPNSYKFFTVVKPLPSLYKPKATITASAAYKSFLLFAYSNGDIFLYNADTREQVLLLTIHGHVSQLSVSKEGKMFVLAKTSIYMFDLHSLL